MVNMMSSIAFNELYFLYLPLSIGIRSRGASMNGQAVGPVCCEDDDYNNKYGGHNLWRFISLTRNNYTPGIFPYGP